MRKQLADWNAKRDQARAAESVTTCFGITSASRSSGATGIAEVRDQKCMGCQVMLRPQTYNEVRNGQQIVVCDSCQRVLYFNPATGGAGGKTQPHRQARARPKTDSTKPGFTGGVWRAGRGLLGLY